MYRITHHVISFHKPDIVYIVLLQTCSTLYIIRAICNISNYSLSTDNLYKFW